MNQFQPLATTPRVGLRRPAVIVLPVAGRHLSRLHSHPNRRTLGRQGRPARSSATRCGVGRGLFHRATLSHPLPVARTSRGFGPGLFFPLLRHVCQDTAQHIAKPLETSRVCASNHGRNIGGISDQKAGNIGRKRGKAAQNDRY